MEELLQLADSGPADCQTAPRIGPSQVGTVGRQNRRPTADAT
ncbi:hypothetical protein HUS71_23630, partial [Pandoraea nosoerga]|nr:hypothetical protein [Pandoraea nosoerga]